MKRALWGFLFLCSAAFAQNTPDNVAADALKKRLEQLKLVNPPKLAIAPRPVVVAPPVVAQSAPPKVCSVPLLNALRVDPGREVAIRRALPLPGQAGNDTVVVPSPAPVEVEKMPVLRPNFLGQAQDFAVLPAPPCER